MSAYRKSVRVRFVIDGTEHEVVLRPMLYEEALSIYESVEAHADERARRRAQVKAAMRLLPGAVQAIEPLVLDAEGQEVSVREMCETAYFTAALRDVVVAWISTGAPENPRLPGASSDDGSPG